MSEEKIYTSMYSRNAELYHHGVKGQKWGVENGPPYPLSSDVSTGKRLKKIEKLEKKSEQNRGYMKKHEDYYDNKLKKENEKVDKKADKKIDKVNKKREFKKDVNETKNYIQLHLNDKGYKDSKEDALKAEIKIKKLLAKENGGKYRYKDMTDEEKEYYRKNVEKKIAKAAWATLLAASVAAGAYEANKLRKPDDYSEYGINQKPSKETRKEIAKGQLERASMAQNPAFNMRAEYSKLSGDRARIAQDEKKMKEDKIRKWDNEIDYYKSEKEMYIKDMKKGGGKPLKSTVDLFDKKIKEAQEEKESAIRYHDRRIKEAERSAREHYAQAYDKDLNEIREMRKAYKY